MRNMLNLLLGRGLQINKSTRTIPEPDERKRQEHLRKL
jgi:hypothetical protein